MAYSTISYAIGDSVQVTALSDGNIPRTNNTTINLGFSYSKGTGADKVQHVYSENTAISGAVSRDFSGGSLVNTINEAFSFTKLKYLRVYNKADSAGNIVLTGNILTASNIGIAGGGMTLAPGEGFEFVARSANGIAVSNGATDTLTITPASTATIYVDAAGE